MRISVIVPSYNQVAFLRDTLDSLASQRYPDLEVRVYDGGSTDGSVEVLRTHTSGFWWRSERDRGQAHAINMGLCEATGDIVAFLNSDDVYYKDTLSRVAAHFSRNPQCQILYADAHHLHADGSVMENYYTEPWNYARLQKVCFICQPSVFWRRKVIDRYGILNENLQFALDYDYWLRIGRRTPFQYMRGSFLAGSRLHKDTKTLGQRAKVHREILDVVIRNDSSEEAILTWLGHLSHYETCEVASIYSPDPADRARWVTMYVHFFLRNASRLGIRIPQLKLSELEQHLNAVGRLTYASRL